MVKKAMQKNRIKAMAIARQWGRALLLSAALVAMTQTAEAQRVFSCDFESAQEQQAWQLLVGNLAAQLENKWYIGAAGQFGASGQNGLFLSSNNGQSATYSATGQMFTLAYRDLPTMAGGDYTILLDYRILGSENAKLHIWWLPTTVRIGSNTSQAPSTNWTTNGGVQIAQGLRNVSVWESLKKTFTLPQNAAAGRLVFVWESSNSTPKAPSACIDNIEIYQGKTLCAAAPTNLKYTNGILKWNGTANADYEVCLYNAYTDKFDAAQQVTGTSWVPTPSGEGVLYMYVRSKCADGGHSEWANMWAFVYQKGARCIEYFDISDDPSATGVCYTGKFQDFFLNKAQGTRQKVDYGYASDESMHTIHYVNEIDPNTADIDGGLHVIPTGEVASVRLGAYTSSGQSARIEYKYTVQQGMSDLLEFKYAAVLESGGHATVYTGGDYQPTLQLEVLDGKGQPLSSTCSQFLFVTGDGSTSKWHYDKNKTYGQVFWCDWTTVTVSLRPYVGQTLTVRLTATRCSYDTHFAYAYFTLGCRSGDIEGIACGDFSTDRFIAPKGFTYRWYKEDDATQTSIVQNGKTDFDTLHIEKTDASIYMLECHNTEDYDCYYTLTCNPNPRFPRAVATATAAAADCQNMVKFTNGSQIVYINRETMDSVYTDDTPQEVIWHFGDGKEEVNNGTELTHLYPEEGGVFAPFVVASMSDGVCTDTLYLDTLRLPNIKAADTDTTIHRCEGDSYELPTGKVVYNDTTYSWPSTNKYGCEATNIIRVRFHEPAESVRTEELCEGGYVDFEGERYTETGVYDVHLKTIYGCDSLLRLNLTILPKLVVSVPDTIVLCADAKTLSIPYERVAGKLSGVSVQFPEDAVAQGMEEEYEFAVGDEVVIPIDSVLRADNYPIVIDFGAEECPADPVTLVLQVHYASLIIEQKNDLIALLNEEYNGGYTWTSYQWYRNGEPVADAKTSYIVVDDSHIGDEYYCVLVRPDGVEMPTCPITYTGGKTAIDNASANGMVRPTLLNGGQTIYIRNAKTIRIVDMMGNVVSRLTTDGAGEATMAAPAQAGVYFVQTDAYRTKIVVK